MSPEVMQRINELRSLSLARELTTEEYREGIRLMREDRVSAAQVSAKSRAKKAPVDTEDLLSKLEGM